MSRANVKRPVDKALRLEQAANLLRIVEAVGAADDDLGEDGEQIFGAIGLARKLVVEVADQLKAERGQGGAP